MAADPALDAFLGTVDPAHAPAVSALDRVVREAHPSFDVAIKYHMLTYALGGDWRTWVCAVQATRKGLHLRFLFGVLLDDPLHVLRPGTSVLTTWDLGPSADAVGANAAALAAYVTEAVRRYPEYKARTPEILAAARAAGRRPG
jgi:hypothetical protein